MNSPVYIATDIERPLITKNKVILGSIPRTNYPVILNKNVAITHHMAVIGVTGTGKSVFSRNLIREYLTDDDVKVICVDFTGEYKDRFSDLNPASIIDDEKAKNLFKEIDFVLKNDIISYTINDGHSLNNVNIWRCHNEQGNSCIYKQRRSY